ncbi:hypothetical protein MFIFM68171_03770 [Madurella fahalii]|uniref:Uncharacterized protein n=1 Tax=Madurella fahalii TaxID=1157608 RepID=A0ABQ0G7I9_9PEZI
MDDAVRLSAEKFRAIYEDSFKVWFGLYLSAVENPSLPASYLSVEDAFPQQPTFPPCLRLKHTKFRNLSRAYATASSIWGSTKADCRHKLLPFQHQLQIEVALSKPIPLSIAETAGDDFRYASWFSRGDQNYLSILILAWAYILSARWTEIMPGNCSFGYMSSQAPCYNRMETATSPPAHGLGMNVDIGNASPEEVRWWAAVLAPGQGWQATLTLERDTFWSPWSIRLETGPQFTVSSVNGTSITSVSQTPHAAAAPSFSKAIHFLDLFCIRHNVTDQSRAALAALLLLPSIGGPQALQLPAPTTNNYKSRDEPNRDAMSPVPHHRIGSHSGLDCDWLLQGEHHLDGLITLSCNTRGIRPMLLSIFYEPTIECNSVTPWLQGAIAAIDSLARDEPHVLGRMFMDRLPQVAFLWLGVTVLGLQKKFLQDVRFGMIPIDLHSAAWSGTMQSFIQEPLSNPLVAADGQVTRADQCRLLFLSQSTSESHNRVPICQWKPFGVTPLADTDVEVRAHAECEGHGLVYLGVSWDCVEDIAIQSTGIAVDDCLRPVYSPRRPQPGYGNAEHIPVSYAQLDRGNESASENATRNIFGWLRTEGYTSDERKIWEHEWFEILESDDEDEDEAQSGSGNTPKSSSHVESWIAELCTEA